MCSSNTTETLISFGRPASEALDLHRPTKRHRSASDADLSNDSTTLFDFDAIFNSLASESEAFPSIAWEFDDDDTSKRDTTMTKKRDQKGLVRSTAFCSLPILSKFSR